MRKTRSDQNNVLREPDVGFDAETLIQAANVAVKDALLQHKARGQSIVVWRNGRVTVLSPEEIPA